MSANPSKSTSVSTSKAALQNSRPHTLSPTSLAAKSSEKLLSLKRRKRQKRKRVKKRRRKRLFAVAPVKLGAEILKVIKEMEIGEIEIMQKQMIQKQKK